MFVLVSIECCIFQHPYRHSRTLELCRNVYTFPLNRQKVYTTNRWKACAYYTMNFQAARPLLLLQFRQLMIVWMLHADSTQMFLFTILRMIVTKLISPALPASTTPSIFFTLHTSILLNEIEIFGTNDVQCWKYDAFAIGSCLS